MPTYYLTRDTPGHWPIAPHPSKYMSAALSFLLLVCLAALEAGVCVYLSVEGAGHNFSSTMC